MTDDELHPSLRPVPNGVPCPRCGAELLDSHPGVEVTTEPPRVFVHCASCGYEGYRTLPDGTTLDSEA